MKGNDIREAYLSFFENKKGHLRMKSFSLIPKDDPSLLLIGAGMAPLKPYFTGKVEPPRHRVTTSQKCIRTGDIENVGHTARHHTFFEMLGNFSFGDYFKKEAITWAWEFLTEVIKLDQSRLYVTIYPDDQEAHDYWHKMIGLPENHIYPLSDNFWEIGEGPCGPDSEIFYDQGEEFGTDPENQMGGDGDRFLEIWNLVFSQFDRQKDGSYLPLAKKNIDTGAGLERLAAVLQHKKNNFETDLFFPIIEEAAALSGVPYGQSAQGDVALKVISDHARAITNMIADGILPSNEGRGYVLRRILRRAVRYGKLLGIQDAFMGQMIDVVINMMKPAYPELVDKQAFIKRVAGVEEERFHATLNAGTDLLSEMLEDARKHQNTVLTGDKVFKLYDTYGFPWELTDEIAKEQGMTIDEKGFEAAMAEQKERARAARAKVSAKVATPDTTKLDTSKLTVKDHDGEVKLLLLGRDGKEITSAADGTEVTAVLSNNPFHAEGGGQIGDTGLIVGEEGTISVEDTKKLPDGIVYVIGTVTEGIINEGETVKVTVDRIRREDLARNHTGTHMLQAALRRVLGDQVNQAGSLVLPDRLRFDFTWPEPLSDKQLSEVEQIVNDEIIKATDVDITEMPLEEAKKTGAMALFGEKYGDIVRVVTIPGYSKELCGGSHVRNTGEIGSFRIISEGGIGSGIRRIEAVTGKAAYELMKKDREMLKEVSRLLKGKPDQITEKTEKLLAEVKELQHELDKLKQQQTKDELGDLLKNVQEKKGIPFFGAVVHAGNMDELRKAADVVKAKLKGGAFILGTVSGDKVNLVGMASPEAVKTGVHMGKVVSRAAKICGGGGGGKPAVAQAGGRDTARLNDAVSEGIKAIAEMLE
ncbi:alanine--tRNA ligase [Dialister sp.]|uniref:alanine--tRNA ligase n=1 Tax=Dialister sp. TaxID=1955814 RepID=UPI002E8122A0|nr:alanine--tRNA ligase [Dialister sp.]MEE3452175.1 alanine--tRNA ligase [Dialister sp.]